MEQLTFETMSEGGEAPEVQPIENLNRDAEIMSLALNKLEDDLANAGADLELGATTKDEKAAFAEALSNYKDVLGEVALSRLNSLLDDEGLSESEAEEQLVNFLIASKQDVLGGEVVAKLEQSWIERLQARVAKSRIGSAAIKIAITGATLGTAAYVEKKIGPVGLGISAITTSAAVAYRQGVKKIRESAIGGIDEYALEDDETEDMTAENMNREDQIDFRSRHYRKHITGLREDLFSITGKHHLERATQNPDEAREALVTELVDKLEESIETLFDLDSSEKDAGRAEAISSMLGKMLDIISHGRLGEEQLEDLRVDDSIHNVTRRASVATRERLSHA